MGLCLSICDIGVIMGGAGGWELGAEDFTLHTSHSTLSYGTQRYSNHFDFLCEM